MEARTPSFTLRQQIFFVLFLVPLMVFVALWHLLLQSTVAVRESAVWSAASAEVFGLVDVIEREVASTADGKTIGPHLAKLEAMVAGNPEQMRVMRRMHHTSASLTQDDRAAMFADLAEIRREQMDHFPDRMQGLEGSMFSLELASLGLFVLDLVVLAGAGYILWKMQHLRNYVTACSWTQTILHEGEWLTFEQYLKCRFGVQLSHGICPQALEKIERGMRETPPIKPTRAE